MKIFRIAAILPFLAACADGHDAAPASDVSANASPPSATIEQAAPSDVSGSFKARFQPLNKVLQQEVDDEIRSGFVYAILRDGVVVTRAAFGAADREAGIAMSNDVRFRIASMTKPITTVAILMLVDEGAIGLDDPLSKYIPAFETISVATSVSADSSGAIPTEPLAQPITIRHLLTHTAGLGYVFDVETDLGAKHLEGNLFAMEGALAERIPTLASLPLYEQPGEKWIYSYATDVLGRVVEIASGQSLEAFMTQRIFTPLGMDDTEFAYDETDLNGVSIVYAHNESGDIVRYEGESLAMNPNENGAGWFSGGGGLISTADDYLAFCQMLIEGGVTPQGNRLLSEERVDEMFTSQIPLSARPDDWREQNISFGFGGWVALANPDQPGNDATSGHFGWGGYYDTAFGVSRYEKTAYVILAQREPGPHDKPSAAQDMIRALTFAPAAKN